MSSGWQIVDREDDQVGFPSSARGPGVPCAQAKSSSQDLPCSTWIKSPFGSTALGWSLTLNDLMVVNQLLRAKQAQVEGARQRKLPCG